MLHRRCPSPRSRNPTARQGRHARRQRRQGARPGYKYESGTGGGQLDTRPAEDGAGVL